MQALLLDHDDVLVMSETLVFKASCSLINEVIQQKGVTYQYTPLELKEKFTGLGFTQIMRALELQHRFEITSDELQQFATEELNLVAEFLEAKVESSPGAADMLTQVRNWGVACAVVSSSELRRIRACLRRTGFDRYISHENVFSAADSLEKPEPKPSPAIYDLAVQALGVAPEQCLAVEDSSSGVLAAVQAKIEVVGYVGAVEESSGNRAMRNRILIEAGAKASFSDWTSFLAWVCPRVSTP